MLGFAPQPTRLIVTHDLPLAPTLSPEGRVQKARWRNPPFTMYFSRFASGPAGRGSKHRSPREHQIR